MNLQRKTYTSRGEKGLDFFIGFAGFYVINGILWGVVSLVQGLASAAIGSANIDFEMAGNIAIILTLVLNCGVFIINIAALILLGLTRYWMALGILGAFVTGLILAICATLLIGGACFAILYSLEGQVTPAPGALIWSGLQWLR